MFGRIQVQNPRELAARVPAQGVCQNAHCTFTGLWREFRDCGYPGWRMTRLRIRKSSWRFGCWHRSRGCANAGTGRGDRCPLGDPQPDIRTVGRAATATCEGAVSYDLSGERLTERGLSGRPHPAPGPRTRRASAGQRYIRWFFRQYYRGPDAVRADGEPAARATAPAPVSRTGQFDLSIGKDGSVRIHFTPTGELATDLRPGA